MCNSDLAFTFYFQHPATDLFGPPFQYIFTVLFHFILLSQLRYAFSQPWKNARPTRRKKTLKLFRVEEKCENLKLFRKNYIQTKDCIFATSLNCGKWKFQKNVKITNLPVWTKFKTLSVYSQFLWYTLYLQYCLIVLLTSHLLLFGPPRGN